MTRRLRVVHVVRAALAMLAATGPRAAAAQVTTFDILSFVAPTGWARSERAGLVMWQRTGQTGNELWTCTVAVFESRPSSGNPGADFESDWLDLLKYEAGRETAESKDVGNGWTRLSRMTRAQQSNGPDYDLSFVTYSGHGRVTSIRANIAATACTADVKAFLASIKPMVAAVVAGAVPGALPAVSPVVPSAGASGGAPASATALVGVWRGLGLSRNVSGITNTTGTGYSSITWSSKLGAKHVAFFDDGSVTLSVPDNGLLDYKERRQREPTFWGTYTYADGKGTVRFGTSVTPFEIRNGSLLLDGYDLSRIAPSGGLRIQGTFSAERNPERYGASVKEEPTIAFGGDGTFSDHGAMYWLRHVRGSAPDNQDATFGSGTYEIQNYTVTFTYNDGRKIRLLYLDTGESNKAAPTQIRLGTFQLLDRK